MNEPVVLARVVRSGVVESVHLGHVAVCDRDGRLVASAGNPDRVTFPRSSLKPLQAAVSLDASGETLTDEDVAIMCSSHNGEPVHVAAVRALLARRNVGEDALRCPPAWPWWPEDAAGSGGPSPILHNCSGKHGGMLVACMARGWDTDGYLDPGHPLQQRIRLAVEGITERSPLDLGVDGCGAPVYPLPLHAIATMFARLVSTRGVDLVGEGIGVAVKAMRRAPYLVGGRNRVDTALMEAVEDLVVKSGAEGLICAAHAGTGIGVAVRVDDGAARAAAPALVRTLRLLEVAAEGEGIDSIAGPPVLGGGRPIGALTSDFVLTRPYRGASSGC